MEPLKLQADKVLDDLRIFVKKKVDTGETAFLPDWKFNEVLEERGIDSDEDRLYILGRMKEEGVWERLENGWAYGIKFTR